MTLHLTRHEADRLTADGRVVLFRKGEWLDDLADVLAEQRNTRPPAEFVEAAKPCELCDPRAWVPRKPDLPCGDCLDGKRRIAAVVPCGNDYTLTGDCGGYGCDGTVTVGHVVVESGPESQDDGRYRLAVRVVG